MDEKFMDQLIGGQAAILKELKEMSGKVDRLEDRFIQMENRQGTFERKQDVLSEYAGNLVEGQARMG